MNKIRMIALAFSLLLLSAMALTACGGDDDSDSGDNGGNGSEATESADDEATPAEQEEEEEATPTEEASAEEEDNGGSGEAVSDPCTLISQSDVAAALGEEVQDPVVTYTSTANVSGNVQAQVGTCNYVSPSGFSSISLTVWSAPGEESAIGEFAEAACTNKEEAGLGDASCWYDDSHLEIQVASGDVYIDMFVTSSGDTTAILESLAATAVENIP